jgi:hypothetical protein
MKNTRMLAGIVTGLIYGLAIFWGAVFQALPVGGLVLLAAAAIGLGGGLIGGALLYVITAVCPVEEKKEAGHPELPEEYRAAA